LNQSSWAASAVAASMLALEDATNGLKVASNVHATFCHAMRQNLCRQVQDQRQKQVWIGPQPTLHPPTNSLDFILSSIKVKLGLITQQCVAWRYGIAALLQLIIECPIFISCKP
jgi:hypothetical protein